MEMKDVRFDLCKAGFCLHPEVVTIQGGSMRSCQFPSLFGLIRHPQEGLILYDTGYHPRYNSQKINWPEGLYPRMLPANIPQQETALETVRALGYQAEDVSAVIISHFHGDHIAGLIDFPRARLLCMRSGFLAIDGKSRWKNLINGFLPGLLPGDFKKRIQWIEDIGTLKQKGPWELETPSFDIFRDRSLYAIPLAGHQEGQIGLGFNSEMRGPCFLVADSAWSRRAILEFRPPSRLAAITMHDREVYLKTLAMLGSFSKRRSDVQLLPSHCRETFSSWNKGVK